MARRKRRAAGLGVVVAGLAAFTGCGGNGAKGSGTTVEVRITPAGCDPAALTLAPGRTTFHITNEGADSVTEYEILSGSKIIAEKENLTPGLDGSFTLDLPSGSYTLACPGGSQHATGTLEVRAG